MEAFSEIACKCYDSNGQYIYDVEIQKQLYPNYPDRTVLNAAQLLSQEASTIQKYPKLPKIRVISVLNQNYDDSLPGIFDAQIIIPKPENILPNIISWTYLQLPKLKEEGTKLQWLQILAAGIQNSELVPFNTPIEGIVYKSGLTLLQSYTQPAKLKLLADEATSLQQTEEEQHC